MIVALLLSTLTICNANQTNQFVFEKSFIFLNHPGPIISKKEEALSLADGHLGHQVVTEEETWLKAFEADLQDRIAIPKSRARHFSLRPVSGSPSYYAHICPTLELFKSTPIENLKCDRRLVEKLKFQNTIQVKSINLASVMTTIKGCLCKKYTVTKGCTSWFFGAVTKDRSVTYNTPIVEECRSQCIKDHSSARDGSKSSPELDYRCKWPVHNTVTTTIVETAAVFVTYETMTKRMFSGIFQGGSCAIEHCKVAKPNIFVLREPEKERCSYLSSDETFSYQQGKGNLTILESQTTGIQYPILGGCILRKCSTNVLTIPSGQLFELPQGTTFNLSYCDTRTYRLPTRTEIPPKIEKTWEDLYDLYDKCLMKRQIIRNALWSKVPLDVMLLKEFNQDNGLRTADTEIKYLVLNNQLLSASCVRTIYYSIEWRNHDLWVLSRGDKVIGCLDARLGIVFQGLCRPYNSTMVYHALGTWKFQPGPNETYVATHYLYSETEFIKTITGVWYGNEAVREAFEENRNPIIEDPSYENAPPQGETKSSGLKFRFPNLFTGLASSLFIIFVILLAIGVFFCFCKIKRIPAREYIPLQTR